MQIILDSYSSNPYSLLQLHDHLHCVTSVVGRRPLRRLVAGFHRGGPGSSLGQVILDLWWTDLHWGKVSPSTSISTGARGSIVVKALCYKPEGRWFDTR
jgi:hypothetical protein